MRDWPLWEVFVRSRRGLSHVPFNSEYTTASCMRPRLVLPPITTRSGVTS